ncbi:hypothetical protein VTK73DRAFT_2649 [Phialemonium thermophilum]|uniref:F-box domain-containing protein n=1 Tax=Phialemonium thermophilum TaxID=223376 RepID=A0ABR3X399_9PEZI
MALLPSYQEAVAGAHWLELVAPYAHVRDYPSLCLVSPRFYEQFAPRLWSDPLRTIRVLGLDPGDDLKWYYNFVLRRTGMVRRATRCLVLSLDFRAFAIDSSEFDIDTGGRSLSQTFAQLPSLFPKLRCILLDGHPDLDPSFFSRPADPTSLTAPSYHPLLLLSIPHCQTQVPVTFFGATCLRGLVYLDVSDAPGFLKNAVVQSFLSPTNMPSLRILKARDREMDDDTAVALCRSFKDQLWSLDLSRNRLTDAFCRYIGSFCFPPGTLRTSSHFEIEGFYEPAACAGSVSHGPFGFVQESEWSVNFNHPDRHVADAPIYTRDAHLPTGEVRSVRHNGRAPIMSDIAGDVKEVLAGTTRSPRADVEDVYHDQLCQHQGGVTHLHLSGNNAVSARAVQRLIRSSPGHLRHLDCGSLLLDDGPSPILPPWLARTMRLSGFLGAAHLFRPALSPNLQVLRIHHSLVTQIPSLESEDLVAMADLWLAETFVRPRVELAYPEVFVPDMNPRLYSLTLTNLPRYSTGPLIRKLIKFLRLAAAQERAIRDAKSSSSRRSPIMLRGLRHIRLEFDPDPTEELGHSLDSEDLDPGQPINLTSKEFSFFGDHGWGSSLSQSPNTPQLAGVRHSDSRLGPMFQTSISESVRLPPQQQLQRLQQQHQKYSPQPRRHGEVAETGAQDNEYVMHTFDWNGTALTLPVWIGSTTNDDVSASPAVKEYTRLLRNGKPHHWTDPVPASPCHVRAGVPTGVYLFNAAWDAMLVVSAPPSPRRGDVDAVRRPTRVDLASMRDVVAALKEYRTRTRMACERARGGSDESHDHWTGKLEVVLKEASPSYRSSKFWR